MYWLVQVLLGTVVLGFGRALFWLFVAIAGFVLGMEIGTSLFPEQHQLLRLAVGVVVGLIGALVAKLFPRVAFALAGFYAGGYVGLILGQGLGLEGQLPYFLALFLGIVAAICAWSILDWAIIALSCLAGAGMIVDALALKSVAAAVVFAVLCAVGLYVQSRQLTGSPRTEPDYRR